MPCVCFWLPLYISTIFQKYCQNCSESWLAAKSTWICIHNSLVASIQLWHRFAGMFQVKRKAPTRRSPGFISHASIFFFTRNNKEPVSYSTEPGALAQLIHTNQVNSWTSSICLRLSYILLNISYPVTLYNSNASPDNIPANLFHLMTFLWYQSDLNYKHYSKCGLTNMQLKHDVPTAALNTLTNEGKRAKLLYHFVHLEPENSVPVPLILCLYTLQGTTIYWILIWVNLPTRVIQGI